MCVAQNFHMESMRAAHALTIAARHECPCERRMFVVLRTVSRLGRNIVARCPGPAAIARPARACATAGRGAGRYARWPSVRASRRAFSSSSRRAAATSRCAVSPTSLGRSKSRRRRSSRCRRRSRAASSRCSDCAAPARRPSAAGWPGACASVRRARSAHRAGGQPQPRRDLLSARRGLLPAPRTR